MILISLLDFDLLPNSPSCEVNIRNGTPSSKDPIYLDLATNLWVPGPKLVWDANQASLAVCPGSGNEITLSERAQTTFLNPYFSSFSNKH
jgi:hypothetical protein